MDWIQRSTWLSAMAACAACLVTIWLPPVLPCADLPGHLQAASVHLDPAAFEGLLVPNTPPTALGFVLPTVWFGYFLPLHIAGRLVLTLYLVASCVGFAGISRALGSSIPLGVIAGLFVCIGWSWAMGFANYVAGLSAGALGVWGWVESRERPVFAALAGLTFVIAGACHIPAAVVMASWGLWVYWGVAGTWRTVRSTWVLVPLIVYIAYVQMRQVAASGSTDGWRHGEWEVLPVIERVQAIWQLSVDAWSPVAGIVVGSAAVIALVSEGSTWARDRRQSVAQGQPGPDARRTVLAGMVIGVIAFLLLPLSIADWSYLSPRVLPPIVVSGLLALPPSSRTLRSAGLALGIMSVCSFSATFAGVYREGSRLANMVQTDAFPAPGRVYSMVFGVDSPHRLPRYVVPGRGLAAYAMAEGGAGPGMWANFPAKDSVLFASPVRELFPSLNGFNETTVSCALSESCSPTSVVADAIARDALQWDSLFMAGARPETLQILRERGYRQVHPNLWVPVPCEMVAVLDPRGMDGDGILRIGVQWPRSGVLGASVAVSAADAARSPEPIGVPMQVAAGGGTVFAFVDRNGDQRPGASEWVWQPQPVTAVPGETVQVHLGIGAPLQP